MRPPSLYQCMLISPVSRFAGATIPDVQFARRVSTTHFDRPTFTLPEDSNVAFEFHSSRRVLQWPGLMLNCGFVFDLALS